MKKVRLVCILLTLLAAAARIMGIASWNTVSAVIAFLAVIVILSRGLETYNQGKREYKYWLVTAGFVFITLVMMLTENYATVRQQKLLCHVLEAPASEVTTAYKCVEQEAKETSSNISLKYMPSTSQLRDAIQDLFDGKASEEFIDECISMNDIMSYQMNASDYEYQMKVKELKLKKFPQEAAYSYEAVIIPQGIGVTEISIHIYGTLADNPLSSKVMGESRIQKFTIEGEELEAFYKTLE